MDAISETAKSQIDDFTAPWLAVACAAWSLLTILELAAASVITAQHSMDGCLAEVAFLARK